jgi:hypothetical protein
VRHLLSLALLLSLVAVGCKSGGSSPQSTGSSGSSGEAPTGPGKKAPPSRPTRLDVEIVPVPLTIKGGEKKKWPITVKRSGGYDKEFTIMLSSDDAGIKVPDEVKVPSSKDDSQTIDVEVEAAAKAKNTQITLIANCPGFEDPRVAKVNVTVEK